ncbi:MAG: NUDIX domain-containing protein [Patescibacteria group bacterium]
MQQNFCRRCGAALTSKTPAVYACPTGHTIFSNPAPTAGIFLLDSDGMVILSIRGINPGKGRLDSIGGFVDDGESFEQAVVREIREETGLSPSDYSTPVFLTSAPSDYDYDGETRSVLSCFYYAMLNPGATPDARDDVAELIRIAPNDVKADDMWSNDTRIGIQALLAVLA